MENTEILKVNNHKPTINAVVIVEGKTDTNKLKKLFDVQTIETNGLNLKKETIDFIIETSKIKPIILFLDPDGPGEKIRKKLQDYLSSSINVFINKKDIDFSKKKIGVAEAYDQAIIDAFKNYVVFDKQNNSISWQEYLNLKLNTKILRKKVCDYFHISECNNKQLFKRLNMMNIKYEQVLKVINNE